MRNNSNSALSGSREVSLCEQPGQDSHETGDLFNIDTPNPTPVCRHVSSPVLIEHILDLGQYTQFALLQVNAGISMEDAIWNAKALRLRLDNAWSPEAMRVRLDAIWARRGA
jgi:hypothetical protein